MAMTMAQRNALAWKVAKHMAGGSKGSRSYIQAALTIVYEIDKIIVNPTLLPLWTYRGMISPHMYATVQADKSGSDTFYNHNRNKGRAGIDDLDPALYRTVWVSGADRQGNVVTPQDVMRAANLINGALPDDTEYREEINYVVYKKPLEIYESMGGEEKDLLLV